MTSDNPGSSSIWTWRTGLGHRRFSWVFAALTPLMIAATVWAATGFRRRVRGRRFASDVRRLGGYFCVLANRPLLAADDDGVSIRNVVTQERLRWNEITTITPGYWGLRFERSDGRPAVHACALAKSNYSQALGTRPEPIWQHASWPNTPRQAALPRRICFRAPSSRRNPAATPSASSRSALC